MPRGQLEPMWLAGVSVGLPVWSYRKQNRAVAESRARADASAGGAEAIEQILRLRVAERRSAYEAVVETARLFREGLLVQSRATAESTLAQYRVGKVTFASVLEANAGYIGDEEGFLARRRRRAADRHRRRGGEPRSDRRPWRGRGDGHGRDTRGGRLRRRGGERGARGAGRGGGLGFRDR